MSDQTTSLPDKGVGRPDGAAYGRTLRTGLGVNLLVREIDAAIRFQAAVLAATVRYYDDDFALVSGYEAEWMLHADRSYASNALLGVVLGSDAAGGVRGAGVELRLYGCDPDAAAARAARFAEHDHRVLILAPPEDKPHGQREAIIVDPDGYAWIPGVPRD